MKKKNFTAPSVFWCGQHHSDGSIFTLGTTKFGALHHKKVVQKEFWHHSLHHPSHHTKIELHQVFLIVVRKIISNKNLYLRLTILFTLLNSKLWY
jgi:hypothetical protein